MSDRIDFSDNARIYDRRHGAAVSDEAVDRLWTAAGLAAAHRVIDIGAGTGRVAIPLAARGCTVVAVEPSAGMLDQLRAKTGATQVWTTCAEGARLPFATGSFDVAVIARLLYLTSDWPAILREAHRVLRAGGLLLHEWGNGSPDEDWVQIREEARRLFENAGVAAPFHPGARSEAVVDRELEALDVARYGQVVIGSGPVITLREFLRRLVEGEFSYTWNVPAAVRSTCLPVLEQWCAQTFDLDRPLAMPRQLTWTLYRRKP